ncbi:MAG: flagellar biosynthetic protein FliR [bacterium]|nr:flagellar biosynthetic protein FliR [bacterium]
MPLPYEILELYFYSFIIILIRITSFFFTAPVFGGQTFPAQAKIGFGVLVSAIVLIVSGPISASIPSTLMGTVVLVAGEVAFGLTLGYSVSLVFAGIQIGGMLIGYQMGFAVANVLDPISNDQVSIIGQYLFLFAILYFLAMDAHHILIKGIVDSFIIAPVGSFSVQQGSVAWLVGVFSRMFWLGLKVAIPVVGAIFLVDVALGIISKTVPQMNVFIVGLPLKSLLGMIILALGFPFFALVMRYDFDVLVRGFYGMIRAL